MHDGSRSLRERFETERDKRIRKQLIERKRRKLGACRPSSTVQPSEEDQQRTQVARWLSSIADAIAQGTIDVDVCQYNSLYRDEQGNQVTGGDQCTLLYLKPSSFGAVGIPEPVRDIIKKWMGHSDD